MNTNHNRHLDQVDQVKKPSRLFLTAQLICAMSIYPCKQENIQKALKIARVTPEHILENASKNWSKDRVDPSLVLIEGHENEMKAS
jgi:hypothetical protein